MIEVAGSRYALGPRTARSARVLTNLITVSYALFLLHGVLLLGGWPRGLVITVLYLFLTALSSVVGVFYLLAQTFSSADSQQIEPAPPAPGNRIRRWWVSPKSAWMRSTPIWLGAVLLGLQLCLLLLGRYVSDAAYYAAVCSVAALVMWHLHACRAMNRHISHTAQLGGGEPYAMFDWDEFDSSAEGLFRARFGSRSEWKAPCLIIHPVEADRYARRARHRRFMHKPGAAFSALTALVFAQQILSEVLRSTWHDITHLTETSPQPTGFAYIISLQVASALFLVPLFFQHLASEMDSLSKPYDEQHSSLLEA